MKKTLNNLANMCFDAGGPILLIAILGAYVVFGLIIVAIIVVAIVLIRKALKKKQ